MNKKGVIGVLLVALLVVSILAVRFSGEVRASSQGQGANDAHPAAMEEGASGTNPENQASPSNSATATDSVVTQEPDSNASSSEEGSDTSSVDGAKTERLSRIPDFDDEMKYPRADYWEVTVTPLGPDQSDLNGDKDAAIHKFYDICYNQPESLACAVTAFPSILEKCGIETNDPVEIDYMFDMEGGGSLQDDFLIELDALLDDPTTKVTFTKLYEDAYLISAYKRNPIAASTPDNIGLVYVPQRADYSPQMVIEHTCADGTVERGMFDMQTGFQRVIELHTDSE